MKIWVWDLIVTIWFESFRCGLLHCFCSVFLILECTSFSMSAFRSGNCVEPNGLAILDEASFTLLSNSLLWLRIIFLSSWKLWIRVGDINVYIVSHLPPPPPPTPPVWGIAKLHPPIPQLVWSFFLCCVCVCVCVCACLCVCVCV